MLISLDRAFKSADHDRIDLVKIFLDAGLTGDPLHSALAMQAKRGNDSLPVCALLLTHGASGDEYNGEALTTAAKLAALPLLQAMIQRKVSDVSLTRAFKSADHQNLDLIKILLDAGLKGEPLHTALVEQSKRGNEGLAVCTLLLAHGASADEYNGEALTTAARLEALPLLQAMLKDKVASKATLNRAFKSANHENLDIVTIFLDVGLTGEPLDTALVEQSKRGNEAIAVCKLLLTYGASVDTNHGEALTNAAKLDAPLLLRALLSERPVSNATLTRAFKSADSENIDLVKIFLDAGLKGKPLHSALIEQSKRGNDALAVCRLLVTHGASINANNGEALANAAGLSAVSLLRMMLQGQEILNVSLTWAFKAADHKQYEIVELFLKAGLHGEPLHSALVMQGQRGDEGLAICELFLKHGADINEYDGEAPNEAAASGNVKLMQAMLHGRKATPKTLSRVFESVLQLHDQPRLVMIQLLVDAGLQAGPQIDAGLLSLVQSGSKDIDSMRELLTLGASVHHENHGALDAAAQLCHHDVLLLLLEYLTDASALSLVFGDRLQESWSTLTKEMVGTLEILLKNGAQGEDVQRALVLAISESDTNPLARSFAGILLNHDVDVNYEQGRPLQIAAEIAALDFLSIMIAKGATPESLVMAFPHIFKVQPRANEGTMLSLIELFREHAGDQLSSAVHPTIPDPSVFMSVYNYPEKPRVLEAVLDTGFSVDQKMLHHLPDIGSIEITPLYWALLEHEEVVTEPVVYMLLKRGGTFSHSITVASML
jgi:ankyrin repeat protein